MRILYITHTSNAGGATTALVNVACHMARKGHEVHILTYVGTGALIDMLKDSGVHFHYAPISLTIWPLGCHFMLKPLKFIKRWYGWQKTKHIIKTIINKYSIDLVHTNVGPLDLALNICSGKHIPHVWHQREFFDRYNGAKFYPNNKKFYEIINCDTNYNICVTQQVKDYLKLSDVNAMVIYDGVFSCKKMDTLTILPKEKYFLYAGRIEKNKGLDTILNIWSDFIAKHPDYKLMVAGGYSEKSDYYRHCISILHKHNIASSVIFLGYRNDISSLMERSSALIVPSHVEGFGFTIVEGMLNGTPVIGRNTTGIKEQFDNGLQETGDEIGIRFTTENELLKAMEYVVNTDLTKMLMRAQQVIGNYTIEQNVDNIERLYRKLLRCEK